MKEVNIYVQTGIIGNLVSYCAIIEYKGHKKYFHGINDINKTTVSRELIKGMTAAVSCLREKCIINAYCQCQIGLKKKRGVNYDLISVLKEKIEQNAEQFNFNIIDLNERNHLRNIAKKHIRDNYLIKHGYIYCEIENMLNE